MPSPVVVNTRNSRHGLKSFSAGSQPLAMPSSLAGSNPIRFASAVKFGCRAGLSGFLERGQFGLGNSRRAGRRGGGNAAHRPRLADDVTQMVFQVHAANGSGQCR